jgi:hypothetical protein
MWLQCHAGKTFPPLYCTTLMYRVVKDTPAENTLSGYRTWTKSVPSFSSAALWATMDFLPAKEAPFKDFERFDATAD